MKNGQEVWKTIKEFPTYSVSNFGRVKNDKRNYILHGGYDNDGYRQVTLSYNGKQYNRESVPVSCNNIYTQSKRIAAG